MTRTRRIAAVTAITAGAVLGAAGIAQASSHHGHGHDRHGADAYNGPTLYDSHHPGRSGPEYGVVGGLLYVITHL